MRNELEEEIERSIQKMTDLGMSSEQISDALSSMFIPASELGFDKKDFSINIKEFTTQLYHDYAELLKNRHTPNSYTPSYENKRKERNTWAADGRMKGFQWYALTNYYNPTIHTIDTEKENENNYFRSIVTNQSNVVDKFFDIISDISPDISTYAIRAQPIFCNFSDFSELDRISLAENSSYEQYCYATEVQEFENRLRDGFGYNYTKVIEAAGNKNISVLPVIKDANVIYFDIMLDEGSNFTQIADVIMRLGAKSVIGIFLTRVCPTITGKYPSGQGFKSLAGQDYITTFARQISINLSSFFKDE